MDIAELPRTTRGKGWREVNQGDFARVYDAQYSRVFRYLLWRLRDRSTAELLAAEVFATALTACQKGAAPRQIGSWLVGIADHLASQTQHRSQSDQRPAEANAAAELDPEELALGRMDSKTIWQCVDALSAEQREILLFRIVAGLSAREVGELIGRTEEAVRRLQLQALLALREMSREAEICAG